MINHLRTLLMNVDGIASPLLEYFAEEIVDPSFEALTLPTEILKIRNVLFGASPDRYMLNYRCRQLLALTHSTPLAVYVTNLDPRITYDFSDNSLLPNDAWNPVVVKVRGTGTLTVFDQPTPSDAIGVINHRYTVSVDVPGLATVAHVNNPISNVDLEFAAGDKIPLPFSGLRAQLTSTSPGQYYTLATYSRPLQDMSGLAIAASNLGEPVYLYVFGITKDEPFLTFRNLWNNCKELPLRLSALVCAVAYRCEQIRLQSGA